MKAAVWLVMLCALAFGQSGGSIVDVTKITHGIERRYNNLKTLRVNFTETLIERGGRRQPLTGTLFLEKPRKMRWDYSSQPGRFFLSDGSFDYDYDPKNNNEVERSKVKDTDDLRGPLAFLLGKVDFDRDFGSYSTGGADGAITAIPKSDKLLFSAITFIAAPDFSIRKLSIQGQDGSTTIFVLEGEVVNPALNESLFRFVKPPGASVVDK
jgi:outer membrane lipoprotein carrier protein